MLVINNQTWLKQTCCLRLSLAVSLLSACLFAPSAFAEAENESNWLADRVQLRAFGTIGASYHDEAGLEYRRNIEQKNGVSAKQLDFSSDSLLGGQADLLINNLFSASTQVVSRNNAEGNWKPELITAFLRYQPNENIQLRLGRMTTFSNVGAETRYAGYAYTEVRPSTELYGLFGSIDRYDGVSLEYTTPFATGIGKVMLTYGDTVGELFVSRRIKIDHTRHTGITANWQKGDFEIRGLYNHYRIKNEISYEPIAEALAEIPFPDAQLRAADIRSHENYSRQTYGAAVRYTPGPWQIKAVLGAGRQSDFNKLRSEAGSVLIGYKMGQLTPYAIAAYARARTEVKPSGVPNLTPQLIQLNSFYQDALTGSRIEQDSLSLGLRYDVAENYALKFQVDKINAQRTPLTFSTRNEPTDKDLTLFTIALDFLF